VGEANDKSDGSPKWRGAYYQKQKKREGKGVDGIREKPGGRKQKPRAERQGGTSDGHKKVKLRKISSLP